MQKNTDRNWPEIVFGSSDPQSSQAISRAHKAGALRKIGPRIYTSNLKETPEEIIKKNRYYILSNLYPNAVISHRSALEGGISSDGSVILSYKYNRINVLPGLTIRLVKGPGPDVEDTSFLETMYIASPGRAYLENMQESRIRQKEAKTLTSADIEKRLDRFIRISGPDEVNRLRDQAKRVSQRLGLQDEYDRLDKLLGALLGTRPERSLQTEAGKSRARGVPFDPGRIELFATVSAALLGSLLPQRPARTATKQAKNNLAFFEAYFSNFIEGTEFAIEEAEQIIFEQKIFPNRPKDSHDILGTFRIISNEAGMQTVLESADQFLSLLQERHALLMQARDDKQPGKFKTIMNRAGNTLFVAPEEVIGTIVKGFEFYQKLPLGLARAIFIMFLIAEVHPFLDGNGRIARIFMNAELDISQHCRIIIPTVYREDYLLSLRKLSRQQEPNAFIRMLLHAQDFTQSISFDNYATALIQLRASNAFMEPSEGKLLFISNDPQRL